MEIKPRRRTRSAGCGVLNGLSGKTFSKKRFSSKYLNEVGV